MTSKTHFKFIEWRDPSGLHEDTTETIQNLEFLNYELQFLINLVSAHTLELLSGTTAEESKSIINQLTAHSKRLELLLKDLEAHRNNLQKLVDDDNVPNELNLYKVDHYKLIIDGLDFHSDLKKTKKRTFELMANLFKHNKQQKLL